MRTIWNLFSPAEVVSILLQFCSKYNRVPESFVKRDHYRSEQQIGTSAPMLRCRSPDVGFRRPRIRKQRNGPLYPRAKLVQGQQPPCVAADSAGVFANWMRLYLATRNDLSTSSGASYREVISISCRLVAIDAPWK